VRRGIALTRATFLICTSVALIVTGVCGIAGSLLVRTPPPNADEALVWRGHVEARPTGVSQTLATHLVDVIDGYRGMVGELLTLARWAGVLIALLGLAQLSMLVHRGPEGGTIAAKAQSDSPPERSGTNAQAI
jgi:hypothetical protein